MTIGNDAINIGELTKTMAILGAMAAQLNSKRESSMRISNVYGDELVDCQIQWLNLRVKLWKFGRSGEVRGGKGS